MDEFYTPARLPGWIIASIFLVIGLIYATGGTSTSLRFLGFALLCVAVAIGWWLLFLRSRDRQAFEQARSLRERQEEERQHARVLHAQDLGRILVQSGTEFEATVRDVLNAQGYDLVRVGRAGDRGLDLEGRDPSGQPVIVQCKRYGPDNKVNSPAVQSFIGAIVNHGATSGIFVATSTFTRDAQRLVEQSRVPVQLIDGRAFTAMARDTSMRV